MRQLGITQKHEIEDDGHRRVQREGARVGAALHEGVGGVRHPPGALGRLRERLQDARRRPSWRACIWAFKQLYDKGLAYEGFRVLPYCWNDETPLSQPRAAHGRRRLQDAPGPVGHGDLPARRREGGGARPDRRRRRSPGRRPRGRCRPTSRSPSAPTSRTRCCRPVPQARPTAPKAGPHATCSPPTRSAPTRRTSATQMPRRAVAAVERTLTGAELGGVQYDRLWDYYAERVRRPQRLADPRRRLRRHRRGHRHRAPGTRLRRGRPGRLRRGRHPGDPVARRRRPLPADACRRWRACAGSRRTSRSRSSCAPTAGCCRSRATSTATRTAGAAAIRSSTRRCRAGSCASPSSATAWASSTSRSTGCPRTSRTASSASGWRTPATGRSAATATGAARSRCGRATTRSTRASTSTARSTSSSATSAGCRSTRRRADLHRPYIDELTRPNPDDPTGAVDDAPHRGRARRLVRLRLDAVRAGALPVREPGLVRHATTPPTSSSSTSGRPAAGSTCMHVLSTALFDRPAFTNVISHGIVLGSDGQKMSKSLRNYPDVSEVFDRDGADAMRWFLMSSSVIRGGNLVVTEEGIRQGVRELLLPLWSTYYFFTLYANARASVHGDPPHRFAARARPLPARQDARADRDVTAHLDDLDSPLAAEALRDFADVLTNWYVRRSRDRFWDGDRHGRLRHPLHGARDRHPARRAAAAARRRRRSGAASPAGAACTSPTGRTPPSSRADHRAGARPWTGCARSPRPASPCARRAGCACGCRSPAHRRVADDASRSRRSPTSCATSST